MFDGKEYVYAVYEEKSFSKAAHKLYITQPALSTAVKKVEAKIGSPIFDRSTSPISLTPSGEIYIDAVEKLFTLEQNTVNQLNNLNGLLTGKLTIGGSIFFSSYILPSLLAKFSNLYPQIQIELVEGTTSQLVEKLFSEEIDLIVDSSELDSKIYEDYYYKTERIVLAIPNSFSVNDQLKDFRITEENTREHKYYEEGFPTLPLKMLGDTPFIFLKENNSLYKRTAKMCSNQGFTPKIIMKPDQLMTAFNMASKGVGATFIPDTLIQYVAYHVPLSYYKMDDKLAIRNMYLWRKRNKYLAKAVEEFIRVAMENRNLPEKSSSEKI